MKSGNGNIVSFGKYKGQPIEIMQNDRAYCDWLMMQDWFRDRYATTYQLIINNFGEPTETPEHNKLQAWFLDDDNCLTLIYILINSNKFSKRHIKIAMKDYEGDFSNISEFKKHMKNVELLSRQFEVRGWDVALEIDVQVEEETHFMSVAIEVKPTIGDDYPAVLRQMKANRNRYHADCPILVYDEFTAAGATEDEVKKIFNESGFHIFSLDEIKRV